MEASLWAELLKFCGQGFFWKARLHEGHILPARSARMALHPMPTGICPPAPGNDRNERTCFSWPHSGMCSVHVLFLHMAKRPNGRLAQVLGTPVKFPSDSRANAIPWHRSSSSQKALWCRGALRVGGVRWAVEVSLGLSLKLLFCNPFSNLPKPDLLQPSLPQPGHQHLLHCALRLGSFGTSWITCTSLIPWATSCSPKTAGYQP